MAIFTLFVTEMKDLGPPFILVKQIQDSVKLFLVYFTVQVVKNPVTDHLPIGCKKIGMSFQADKCVDPRTLVPEKDPVVIVVGAMAHGSVSGTDV